MIKGSSGNLAGLDRCTACAASARNREALRRHSDMIARSLEI